MEQQTVGGYIKGAPENRVVLICRISGFFYYLLFLKAFSYFKGSATQKAGCRGGQRSVPAAGRRSNCIMSRLHHPVKQKAG